MNLVTVQLSARIIRSFKRAILKISYSALRDPYAKQTTKLACSKVFPVDEILGNRYAIFQVLGIF